MIAFSQRLAFLDALQGPLQWHISYNLLMLRQISFAMDKLWANKPQATSYHKSSGHAVNSLKVQC